MTSRTMSMLLALSTLMASQAVPAGTVYQWKDAKGVTHYSDAPPANRKGVQNRELGDGPATPPAQAAAPAENPRCVIARSNLVRLNSDQPVGQDADGDGKPDTFMTADERAAQVRQTEQMLRTICDKPKAP